MEMGKVLGDRYVVFDFIGQGGMANVYLATDKILDRPVAVKALRSDFLNNEDAIRRFKREAVSASQLLHSNIVEVYDVEEDQGQPLIVMEYVQGTDLKTYIRQHAPLSLEVVVTIMSQILSAIEVAHKHNLIHRDIKPQNILITDDNKVKITDFGIAVALTDTSITQTNTFLGSVHYLSPEQARGHNATIKSDIYALGIVLYELITGTVPYDGETAVAIALKHFQEKFPRIKDRIDYVPQSLENVVLKATATNPEERYESVHEMLADLNTSLSASRMNESIFEPHSETKEIEPIKPVIATKHTTHHTQDDEYPIYQDVQPVDLPKKSWKFLKWMVGLMVLAVLSVGGYYVFMQMTTYVVVPDIVELSQQEASELLASHQLTIGKISHQWHERVPQGNVIDVTPESGERVLKGSSVDIVLSNGKEQVEIGDYTGMDYETIRAQLSQLGFIIDRKGFAVESAEQVGKIIAQSEPAGKRVVPASTTMTFTVGTNPAEGSRRMQDFYNLPLTMAQSFVNEYGLVLEVSEKYDDYIPVGQIIEQSPSSGKELVAGDTIHVVVSKGPESVQELSATVPVYIDYIPLYAPSDRNQEKPLPNTIQVFIGDNRNNIKNVAREFTITQSEDIIITLFILENSVGQYRILRNGEVIAESNEVYPE